eukprot:3632891-Amphidinium_carterae.1
MRLFTSKGFIEFRTNHIQTSRVTERLGQEVSLVAPAVGVSGLPWAKHWYSDLSDSGLLSLGVAPLWRE